MEILGLILAILGLFGFKELAKFLDKTVARIWIVSTWGKSKIRKEIRRLALEYSVAFAEPYNVATIGTPIKVTHFVDFLSATTNRAGRALLERCGIRWIKLGFSAMPDKIAVPKLGNVLLADAIASRLGIPLIIVRQDVSVFIRGGQPFEGIVSAGEKVLIVDDVASDGEFLVSAAAQIQSAQASLLGVFCLVNRREGNAKSALAERNIELSYIEEIDDIELSKHSEKYEALLIHTQKNLETHE